MTGNPKSDSVNYLSAYGNTEEELTLDTTEQVVPDLTLSFSLSERSIVYVTFFFYVEFVEEEQYTVSQSLYCKLYVIESGISLYGLRVHRFTQGNVVTGHFIDEFEAGDHGVNLKVRVLSYGTRDIIIRERRLTVLTFAKPIEE